MHEDQRMSFIVNFPELKSTCCGSLVNQVIEFCMRHPMQHFDSDWIHQFSSLYFVSPSYFVDPNSNDNVRNLPTMIFHLNLSYQGGIQGVVDRVASKSCLSRSPDTMLMLFGKATVVTAIYEYFRHIEDIKETNNGLELVQTFPVTKSTDLEKLLYVVRLIVEHNEFEDIDTWMSWIETRFEIHCNSPKRKLQRFAEKYPKAFPYFKDAFEKQIEAFKNDDEGLKKFFTAADVFLKASEDTANYAEQLKPQQPSVKEPAVKKPVAKKPAVKKSAVKTPVAVVFGKFDPFHLGHVSLADRILSQCKAKEVVFVPIGKGVASYEDRFHMILSFLNDNKFSSFPTDKMAVLNLAPAIEELKKTNPKKVNDTSALMPYVQKILGDNAQLYVVQTMPDLFDESDSIDPIWPKAKFNKKLWEQYPIIFVPPYEKFISNDNVEVRCNKHYVKHWLDAQLPPVKRKLMENMTDVDMYDEVKCAQNSFLGLDLISSTTIREMLSNHCNVNDVPIEVYQYIIGNHLYFK